jgi:hypothetical protein
MMIPSWCWAVLAALVLLALGIIYVAFNHQEVWQRLTRHFLRRMGFFILVLLFLPVTAHSEDPPFEGLPPIDGIDQPHPIAPPDAMPKAAAMIETTIESVYRDGWGEQMAVEATHKGFLGNDSLNLSNTTGFFTA